MKKKLFCLLMTCVMLLSMVACGGGKEDAPSSSGDGGAKTEESAEPKILKVGQGENVPSMDPYNSTLISVGRLARIIWNRLVQIDVDGNILPDLATEWTPNEDATEWTFKLREGVTYHDGTPFNAEAVKVSLERFLNETLVNGNMWTTLTGVDVVSDYECVVKFSAPNGALLHTLTMTPILNPTDIKAEGAAGIEKCIGTGPYKLVTIETGNKIVLEKNENYWGEEAPTFDGIEWHMIAEESTRLAGVQTGMLDIVDMIPADLASTVEADPNVQIVRTPAQDILWLGLKCDKYPFDDVNARLAVMYALNRQSIVDNVVLGGKTVRSIIPEGVLGYSTNLPEIEYNPELAKEYLAKSDYKGETLEFIAPIGWYAKMSEQCQAMIADLQAVGFNINFTMLEGGTFSTTRNSGNYDIYTTGCTHASADPNLMLSQRVKGDSAMSGYKNDALMAAIEEGYQANSTEGRQAAYEEVARIMTEEAAPMVPVYQMEQIIVVSKDIDVEASREAFRMDKYLELHHVVMK